MACGTLNFRGSPRRLVALVFCAALLLNSCGASRTGPKVIDADGVRYTACGGVVWERKDGNSKDPATMTYEVLFQDAQASESPPYDGSLAKYYRPSGRRSWLRCFAVREWLGGSLKTP
jgi:hypothetical protein